MSGTRSASFDNSTDAVAAGPREPAGAAGRRGFTLIELLWAMTLSLVVMAAVASLFGVFTRSLTAAQAAADTSARLRTAAWRLRQDLTGVTADLMPPLRPESESGYFEYFEGPCRDAHAKHGFGGWALVGDVDDVLMFTARSEGQPFVGRFGDGTIESPVAEVAWFCRPSPVQPLADTTLFTLYRRQQIVMPYVGRAPFLGSNSTGTASFDPNLNDLSVRLQGSDVIPNSLGDLTKRENRFLRSGTTAFPYSWATNTTLLTGTLMPPYGQSGTKQLSRTIPLAGPNAVLSGARVGEDVILSNILSFDVRAFDPQARRGTGPAMRVIAGAGSSSVTHVYPVYPANSWGLAFDRNVAPGWTEGFARTGTSFLLVTDSGSTAGSGTITDNSGYFNFAYPKTLTLSAPATASGTMWMTFPDVVLEPGDAYWGGPAFVASGTGAVGGYADLAWGGEVKMPLNACAYTSTRDGGDGNGIPDASFLWNADLALMNDILMPGFFPPAALATGAAFPPPGRTAFQSGGVRVRNGALATSMENGSSRTYDTWSTHYESNGVDDDGDGVVDDGTNGLDDNNDGVPDDPAEAETSAPYPARLRGLEIRIRCYEPASGQIRQITLQHTFLTK